MSFHEFIPTDQCNLATNKKIIEQTFRAATVEEIVENLKEANTEFSISTLETLKQMSPTSMKVTMEGLNRGAKCKSIGEDLRMEYRMAKACIQPGSDFYEGIRSVLIDKDHSPKWSPATLEEVTDDMIQEYFAPIHDEWKPSRDEVSKL